MTLYFNKIKIKLLACIKNYLQLLF